MFFSSLRTLVNKITWRQWKRGAGFMLFFSAMCVVFSLAISWLEMALYVHSKGPGYVNEFIGMYLVVGFIFGQFSCVLAFPAHLIIYLKAPFVRAKWYATAASFVASICVWLFFTGRVGT